MGLKEFLLNPNSLDLKDIKERTDKQSFYFNAR